MPTLSMLKLYTKAVVERNWTTDDSRHAIEPETKAYGICVVDDAMMGESGTFRCTCGPACKLLKTHAVR